MLKEEGLLRIADTATGPRDRSDKKSWWETQAGSTGLALLLRSSDGLTYEGLSTPWSLEEGRSTYREIYSIRRNGIFYEEVKRLVDGSWHLYSESSCTRTHSGG